MSVLAVTGLTKRFGGLTAVSDVTFALAPGEFLALIGPNGAGKTTCFNMLNGYIKPDAGTVALEGRSIGGLAPRTVWRLGVGRTFQITQTFSSMTVAENVQMALISHHKRTLSMFARATSLYRAEADALLERVGMARHADRGANTLAYGDLKRLELAVALAHRPKVLLMDEPTAGMAPAERTALMALTGEIVATEGVSVLFTEHDMDVVFAHAHRVLVLNRGELIAEGTGAEIRADRTVQEVYLGGGTVMAPPTTGAAP
ncbi:ABC transporter ATP-binding protein [Acuticoccus sp. I52.16.1]|uniref:ABC transporter ATP-binding protein n=1 Tax=Acuticoccus sp. I52.16.1 TaxID=2928472 RepID=UPI001FD10934|nr:ABC transporter ATP-binding protein [Acuticoccus sp. I52.16.1]UOM35106.1 ABC transporter ATP-binding protein [Acuticoccus sp. I52.16.1]